MLAFLRHFVETSAARKAAAEVALFVTGGVLPNEMDLGQNGGGRDQHLPNSAVTNMVAGVVNVCVQYGEMRQCVDLIGLWLHSFQVSDVVSSRHNDRCGGDLRLRGMETSFGGPRGRSMSFQVDREHQLVKELVTLYFQIHVAGPYVRKQWRSSSGNSRSRSRPRRNLSSAMNVVMLTTCDDSWLEWGWAAQDGGGITLWSEQETREFALQYIASGLIVFDKAASACSVRCFTDMVEFILAAATGEPSFEKAAYSIHSAIAQNDPVRAAAVLRNLVKMGSDVCISLLIFHLKSLFRLSTDLAVDLCCQVYPSIIPWNVAHALRISSIRDAADTATVESVGWFIEYISQLASKNRHDPKLRRICEGTKLLLSIYSGRCQVVQKVPVSTIFAKKSESLSHLDSQTWRPQHVLLPLEDGPHADAMHKVLQVQKQCLHLAVSMFQYKAHSSSTHDGIPPSNAHMRNISCFVVLPSSCSSVQVEVSPLSMETQDTFLDKVFRPGIRHVGDREKDGPQAHRHQSQEQDVEHRVMVVLQALHCSATFQTFALFRRSLRAFLRHLNISLREGETENILEENERAEISTLLEAIGGFILKDACFDLSLGAQVQDKNDLTKKKKGTQAGTFSAFLSLAADDLVVHCTLGEKAYDPPHACMPREVVMDVVLHELLATCGCENTLACLAQATLFQKGLPRNICTRLLEWDDLERQRDVAERMMFSAFTTAF